MIKNTIIAVLGTVVGGLLLILFTNYYSDWKSQRAHVLRASISNDAYKLTKSDLDFLCQATSGTSFAIIRVANAGSENIVNDEIKVTSEITSDTKTISAFGTVHGVSSDSSEPIIVPFVGGLSIKYPLLRPKDSHTIWIANRGYEMFKVSPKIGDLTVVQSTALDQSNDDIIQFAEWAGGAILFFFFGLLAMSAFYDAMLKKIGFDPKEIIKLYEEAKKKS